MLSAEESPSDIRWDLIRWGDIKDLSVEAFRRSSDALEYLT